MNFDNLVVAPDARLAACSKRTVTLRFAGPVDERVDRLVELADAAGAKTDRSEILSALVLAATDDGDLLRELVVALRRAKARDAAVAGDLGSVLHLAQHRPGPRRKEQSAS